MVLQRPHTFVVFATSADGKVADAYRNPPTFGSKADYRHLERRVAAADGVIFGAGTLRSGGTAMRVMDKTLIAQRVAQGKPAQPVQIVCTRSGNLDRELRFFSQPIPRWLLSTCQGAAQWQQGADFDQVLAFEREAADSEIDWPRFFAHCLDQGLETLAVLGGGALVAALLAEGFLDEFWLTLCPVLIGGKDAPTPVDGAGFSQEEAPLLDLIEVDRMGDELILHYRVGRSAA
ncbi:RibD family protein [Lyngbya confervoides]|uniref:Dihydrofolate reductase family protein n=1 Tax=Lyngbya confervoides BDU141951 TaxID=1574623 RepID=A0ABD4SXC5_9CYAN|nr:dihydrofolate reductase family protein [Lyngbya confervoides]MCM1981301.1 dihydrofolate reductase family protein [Lyngbya confervoides BDU141951]